MCVSRSVSLCNYLPSLILIIKSLPLVNKVMCWYRICSVGKETACNAGDPGLIPGLGRSGWRRDRLPTPVFLGFPCASAGKESTCNARDLGSIPGLGKSPGEGKGYPVFWIPSILAWRIPWTVKSMGSQRVGHDWVTCTFTFSFRWGIHSPSPRPPRIFSRHSTPQQPYSFTEAHHVRLLALLEEGAQSRVWRPSF